MYMKIPKRIQAKCQQCRQYREIYTSAYRDICGQCARINHIPELVKASAQSRIGKPRSEETRKKQSIALSGKNNPNFGRTPNRETREKLSQSLSGPKNGFFGKKHSKESIQLMIETRKKNKNNPNRKNKDIETWARSRIREWVRFDPNCDLDVDYIVELYNKQEGKCYYTLKPLFILTSYEWKVNFRNSISLDRLISNKGYKKGNVVLCLYSVNTMKGSLTEQEFYEILRQILINKNQLKENSNDQISPEREHI